MFYNAHAWDIHVMYMMLECTFRHRNTIKLVYHFKTFKSAFHQWSATSLLKKEPVPKFFQTLSITIDLGIVCMSTMFDEISILWHTLKVPNLFYTNFYFSCSNYTRMADDNKCHMVVIHVMHNAKVVLKGT